ncbi:hypothetical protein PJN92_29510, partial [Mycobacterium kansasii]
ADSAATRAAEAAKSAEDTRTEAERKAADLKQKKSRLAQEIARIKAIYEATAQFESDLPGLVAALFRSGDRRHLDGPAPTALVTRNG